MTSSTVWRIASLDDKHPLLLRQQQQHQHRNSRRFDQPTLPASVSSFDDRRETVARHDAQSELEFIVKMGISLVFLLGLAVWFVHTFWHEQQGSRGARSHRRLQIQIYPHSGTCSLLDEIGNTCASKRNNSGTISILDTTLC